MTMPEDTRKVAEAIEAASPIPIFLMTNNFEIGGTERQFNLLARHIDKAAFQTYIGCINRVGPLDDGLEGISEFQLGGSLYGWRSIRSRLKLRRYLRKNRTRIAHAFDFYSNLTLIPSARLAGVPVVIGSHRQLGDLLSPAKLRVLAAAFRCCDAVICNSRAAAGNIETRGVSREKIFVIGNVLFNKAFELESRVKPDASNSLRVCMVARMNERCKNHEGFLRIAERVLRRLPDAQFVLVGDGPLRPEIEQRAASLGIGQRVSFLGARDDIPEVLASMAMAVLTSDSESLSNAILEAMAARLPVVAYNVGGNSELINEQRGFLIEPNDESSFADAIVRLLSDPQLRREQGDHAWCFAKENFSLDRIIRKYEDLYLNLLEKKLGSRRK
jgi:glycosyltransferase involved in cell wall biosynthesis